MIVQLLESDSCTKERIASELRIHPRTLPRRLLDEGTLVVSSLTLDEAGLYLEMRDVRIVGSCAVAPMPQRQAALPGGFVECAETLEAAAARETFEETGVRLDAGALRLHAVSTLPEISEVYVGFIALLTQPPTLVCGAESSDLAVFEEACLGMS